MNGSSEYSWLDRHQQRRAAGLPTVSVLVGTVECAVAAAQGWADQSGRPIVVVSRSDVAGMLEAWIDRAAAGRDLVHDALAWLAPRAGATADDLTSRVRRMTSFELDAFLRTLPIGSNVAAVCRGILEGAARGEPFGAAPTLTARLLAVLADADSVDEACERLVNALTEILPASAAPFVVLAPGEEEESGVWFAAAVESLGRLALDRPSLAVAAAVEPEVLAVYLRQAPESRLKALVRAGVIALEPTPTPRPAPALGAVEIARRLDAATPGSAERLGGSIRRLAVDGASETLVERFLDAAGAVLASHPSHGSGGGEGEQVKRDDRARSAAERFLFERLASLPATAGLFELNAAHEFRFGPTRAMEVDLYARSLKLAVEVDGYHHFRNADDYRRDRRKDLELQRRGCLVVRFLAEDVVARLEEVLATILDAAALRGGREAHERRKSEVL